MKKLKRGDWDDIIPEDQLSGDLKTGIDSEDNEFTDEEMEENLLKKIADSN